MKTIITEKVVYNGEKRVALRFPFDFELYTLVRKLPDSRWSNEMKYWHIPDSPNVIILMGEVLSEKADVVYSDSRTSLAAMIRMKREEEQKEAEKRRSNTEINLSLLSEKGREDIGRYRRWMESNRYPESTVQTYTAMMVKFLKFVSPKEASECTADDLVRIIDEFILPNGLSHSFQNQMISSVKKFYGSIYKSVINPGELNRPRPQHRLPNVLSKDEVRQILSALNNEKHRVMLSLIYACGLRRSELLQLEPENIERSRNLLRVRQSKGFKDRIVPISDRTISMIDAYLDHYKPKRFVFEGQYCGDAYSASSLEKVLKAACLKAGIRKNVTLHWLRHSYATHLLESGTDLRYIQELLGHKSSKTTEIYTHVTAKSIQKIRSPFDDL